MAYFKCGEASVRELVKNGAISIIAGTGKFRDYSDLLADVRYDGRYHSIRSLVQPDDSEVREIARVLVQAPDFFEATLEFVNSFTTYREEVGDYWETPGETLAERGADCDGKAILLCSILRNYIPPEEVFCAFGLWRAGGETTGHMWGVIGSKDGEDIILEATAAPSKPQKGKYIIHGIFNDRYTFATDIGLREFNLKPVELAELLVRR